MSNTQCHVKDVIIHVYCLTRYTSITSKSTILITAYTHVADKFAGRNFHQFCKYSSHSVAKILSQLVQTFPFIYEYMEDGVIFIVWVKQSNQLASVLPSVHNACRPCKPSAFMWE